MPGLYDELKKLDRNTRYPFHMPGHKRNPQAGPLADVMALDITEIDGFDDLHDARGILKEAEARAAKIYGAEETHFLVNGSTAGVLAAVSAVCADNRAGGESAPLLITGRSAHQSFYHAAYLMGAELRFAGEEALTEQRTGIPGTVSPAEVMEALERAAGEGRRPAAVFVTSPNYWGVTADIASIVEIAHAHQVPVIVDEAHGAHFGFGYGIPDSALHAGADLVASSLHKTLPSLTQTALLHTKGTLVDRRKLARFLRIYQTSSPSYVLMASIDACLTQIKESPETLFGGVMLYKQLILQQCEKLSHLHLLSEEIVRDPCKIVISTADTPLTGQELYGILLEQYSIQPEMAYGDTVVLILTGMDTEDGLEAILWSLTAIDGLLDQGKMTSAGQKKPLPAFPLPRVLCRMADAWDAPSEVIPLSEAVGRCSSELVIPYPPGTPLLLPGEEISPEWITAANALSDTGVRIRGLAERDGCLSIPVTIQRSTGA
ncbi:MAG: PLP-dependent transferase [Lachnospiraceae bacterium]|nr:PLP-dependent transferase [Lachnospiraceae bacterium]